MARISRKTRLIFVSFVSVLAVAAVGVVAFLAASSGPMISRGPTEPDQAVARQRQTVPRLKTEVVAGGLDNPWDIGFLPDETMLVSQRSGTLVAQTDQGVRSLLRVDGVRAAGEGGLMGLEVDRSFAENRQLYLCFASDQQDVRLVRYRLNEDEPRLERATPIVTGIPLNPSGRHSGCRVRMDQQNMLWVGTGDAAIGTYPQDPKSLGGKILRVTADGRPAEGNLGQGFDPRIFSYGHRNTQGLALYGTPRGGSAGFSVEHGSSVDDEVNRLVPGNFGWNPVPFYNEQVPMTDTEKYPRAIKAVWSSGNPTIAPSGAVLLDGDKWGALDGALALAVLKDEHLRLQRYDGQTKLQQDEMRLQGEFGRLRSAVLDAQGDLYLSTDNGGGKDQVIRVSPAR